MWKEFKELNNRINKWCLLCIFPMTTVFRSMHVTHLLQPPVDTPPLVWLIMISSVKHVRGSQSSHTGHLVITNTFRSVQCLQRSRQSCYVTCGLEDMVFSALCAYDHVAALTPQSPSVKRGFLPKPLALGASPLHGLELPPAFWACHMHSTHPRAALN